MNTVVAEKEYQKQQANLGWELRNRCNSLGVEARHTKHSRASEGVEQINFLYNSINIVFNWIQIYVNIY